MRHEDACGEAGSARRHARGDEAEGGGEQRGRERDCVDETWVSGPKAVESAALEAAGSSTRGSGCGRPRWAGLFLGVPSCPEPPNYSTPQSSKNNGKTRVRVDNYS